MSEQHKHASGELLLHPVALVALAVWIVNDHVLKHTMPSWLTGKLSDVAGLVVCPLLALAAVELARPTLSERARRYTFGAAVALLGAIMISINLFDSAAWAYRWGLGLAQWPVRALVAHVTRCAPVVLLPVQLTMDPTDLLALPSLLVPAWLFRAARVTDSTAPARC